MNKRIRRKVHKLYLYDVISDVSISHFWREQLFKSKDGEKLLIDNRSYKTDRRLRYLHRILCRYSLKYYVSKISNEDGPKWKEDSDSIIFKFEAVEFPEIYDYSDNNPDSR